GAFLGQLDADDGVHLAGVLGVGGRPVGGHADLGDNQFEVFGEDVLFEELLDLGDSLVGDSQPGAAGGADVHFQGAGIGLREVFAAEGRGDEEEYQQEGRVGDDDGRPAAVEHPVEHFAVSVDEAIDCALPAVEGPADQPALGLFGVGINLLGLQPGGGTGGDQGSRQDIGGR